MNVTYDTRVPAVDQSRAEAIVRQATAAVLDAGHGADVVDIEVNPPVGVTPWRVVVDIQARDEAAAGRVTALIGPAWDWVPALVPHTLKATARVGAVLVAVWAHTTGGDAA